MTTPLPPPRDLDAPVSSRGDGGHARIQRLYLRWVRPLPPTLFALALLIAMAVEMDAELLPAAIVTGASALSGLLVALLERWISLDRLAAAGVLLDTVFAAGLIATLDDSDILAFGMLWPVVVASFVVGQRTAYVALAVSAALTFVLGISDGGETDRACIEAAFVLLIGGGLVTLRRRQLLDQREVQRSQRQLEMAQRLSRSGSWEWEPATDESYWSTELYSIFGLDPASEMGLDVFMSFILEEEHERVGAAVAQGVADGTGYRFDATIRRTDGELRVIEVSGIVEQSAQTGEAERLYGTIQDVTEERELERLRSEFIATASHELRTPAAVVIGFASTLDAMWDNFGDDQRREFIRQIDRAGARLARLIEDLLHASRIETGRMQVELADVDVEEVVRECVRHHVGSMQIDCTRIDGADGAPLIARVDPVRLRQVLDNLVGNVEVHAPRGSAATVELSRENGHVRIDVVDDGPGVPAAHAERIFGRFVRLSIDDAAGTGLGLYISRKLVESQGGTLRLAEQGADEGARFVLSVPAATS